MRRVFWVIALAAFLVPKSAKAECTLVSNGETRPTGTIIHNADHDVLQTCTNDGTWQALTPVGDACNPAATALPGTKCDDGTIFAGISPDGGVPMFTTPNDQSNSAYWGMSSFTTNENNLITGRANSSALYAHVQAGDGSDNPDDGSTPNAFVLCEELDAYGYTDWYVPARDELDVLYTNRNAGDLNGTFDESGSLPAGYYWSSSETSGAGSNTAAWSQSFSAGNQRDNYSKSNAFSLRCVRRN